MSRNIPTSMTFLLISFLLTVRADSINDVLHAGVASIATARPDDGAISSGGTSVINKAAEDLGGEIASPPSGKRINHESAPISGDGKYQVEGFATGSTVTENFVEDTEVKTKLQNDTMGVDTTGKPMNSTDEDEYLEYPDYDIEDSLVNYNWHELLPTLAVYSLTMVLGITGNSLIIFTICRYRRMKSTTNVFLASLASADLLLITICIPVKLAKLFSYTWTLGFFMCKMIHYVQSVSAICSVLTLTAMSIERYYAIVHPMRAKYICTISQARRIILGTWAASFLLAVPILFAQVHLSVGRTGQHFWCVKDWDNPLIWRFHELYMLLLILVVPTLVMAVAYTSICWEIFNVMQRRHDMTTGQGLKPTGSCRGPEHIPLRYSKRITRGLTNNHINNQHSSLRESLKKVNTIRSEEENNTVKQVIKMLVAVVVLFVICWGPMLIDNVLTAYGVLDYLRTDNTRYLGTAFHLMAYFNSCINPLVYGFMSRNFRDSFSKALCLCCHRGRLPKRAMSMSQTRTTSVRYADSSFGRNMSMSRGSTQAEY